MECKYAKALRDNHDEILSICMCRESKNFLHRLDIAFDNCNYGVVDDYGLTHTTEKGGAE